MNILLCRLYAYFDVNFAISIVIVKAAIIIYLTKKPCVLIKTNQKECSMPIQSRYSNSQIETVMQEIVDVLNNNECDRELSLMVLGNTITTVLQQQFPEHSRKAVAKQFAEAMQKSVTQ
jgi:hypothetical protein